MVRKQATAAYKMRKKLREMIQFRNTLPTSNIHPAIAFVRSFYFSQAVLEAQKVRRSANEKKKSIFISKNIMAALASIAFALCASILCNVISAAPQYRQQQVQVRPLESSSTPVAILSQSNENLPDGSFSSSLVQKK